MAKIFNKNKLFLVLIIIGFLLMLAGGINKKTRLAVAPPIYDPISYYSKSQIVWDAVFQHDWKKAFNEFSIRPPGTAFLLYPFGFHAGIHSFLFRATFIPVAIWTLALSILLLPQIKNYSGGFLALALIFGLVAMPMFYHFEPSKEFITKFKITPSQWGLVDGLEGAIGSMALAFSYVGITKKSKLLVILSWFAAALSFFVKPSGILIIGCLFAIVLVELFLQWQKHPDEKGNIFKYGAFCIATGFVVTGISLILAFNTDYLGREMVSAAINASKILIAIQNKPLLGQLKLFIVPVIGIWWFIPIILIALLVGIISIYSLFTLRFSETAIRFLASVLLLCGALYWWSHMAGEDHRYLFPFILMTIAWFLPTVFNWINILKKRFSIPLTCYSLVPALSILYLLYIPNPNKRLEMLMGYNLTTGQYGNEAKMGELLIEESIKLNRPLHIYLLGNYAVGVVEMVDWENSIEHSEVDHHFSVSRVNDWVFPGIRIKNVISSDFFLLENVKLSNNDIKQQKVTNWTQEEQVLKNFIALLGVDKNKGLKLVSVGEVNLYAVTDREKFAKACREWVASIQWEDDFFQRNSYQRGDFDPPS
jgi:hypothetical protein